MIARRSFLTGALALLSAPVVCRAEHLMKVAPTSVILPEYKFDTRCLIDYDIGRDEFMLRIDRMRGRMIRPQSIREVTIEEAVKIVGFRPPILDEQPAEGVQRYLMASLQPQHCRNLIGGVLT